MADDNGIYHEAQDYIRTHTKRAEAIKSLTEADAKLRELEPVIRASMDAAGTRLVQVGQSYEQRVLFLTPGGGLTVMEFANPVSVPRVEPTVVMDLARPLRVENVFDRIPPIDEDPEIVAAVEREQQTAWGRFAVNGDEAFRSKLFADWALPADAAVDLTSDVE